MKPLLRAVQIALAAALILAGTASCSTAPPRLVSLEDGGNGTGLIESKVNTPYVFLGIPFCLDRPGKAVIDSVKPYKPTGGLVVQDFAFMPNPFQLGLTPEDGVQGTIQQNVGPGPNSKTVTLVCPPKSATSKPGVVTNDTLYVQFIRTDSGAIDQGVIINYTSAGKHQSLIVPWDTWICAKGVPLCPGAPGHVG